MPLTVHQIRHWLLRQPRAVTVHIVSGDDSRHEMAVTSNVSWMACAESIHALKPTLIEAHDEDGKVIRAIDPTEQTEGEKQATAHVASPLVLPPGTDPQAVMLIHFADLLAAAYRHSTDVAFERIVGLFEAVNRRSETLERSLDAMNRMLRKQWQDQADAAAEREKDPSELLGDMLQNFGAGQAASSEHETPSNGKG